VAQNPALVKVGDSDPQAPASSCRCTTWGAIGVFAWGAKLTPCDRQNSAINAMLCSSADLRSTTTGKDRSPPRAFQPRAARKDTVVFASSPTKLLKRQSTITSPTSSR
jgi:hypothetical protein